MASKVAKVNDVQDPLLRISLILALAHINSFTLRETNTNLMHQGSLFCPEALNIAFKLLLLSVIISLSD